MTSFDQDPEADAVVLFDVDDRIIDTNGRYFHLFRHRHTRIKILTEAGKDRANYEISYLDEDNIDNFQAHTILPNGKKIKVDKKQIKEEKFEGWRQKVFAFPGVEVGAVIEIKYVHISPYLRESYPWYFQSQDYTVLSQLSLVMEPGFNFSAFFSNTIGVEPITEDIRRPGKRHAQTKTIWRMRDLPAIREEPYMSAIEDYLAVMHFQLVSYKNNYQLVEYIGKWDDLVKKQLERYNDYLKSSDAVSKKASELTAGIESERKKWVALYEFVRDEIESTDKGTIWVEKKPEKVLEEGSGTGAEKNMLLVNMLQSAGFQATPVLISTRSNGRVIEKHPRLSQFNYVLAHIKKGRRSYFMDSFYGHYPFDILPVSRLSGSGLVIAKGPSEFVTIKAPKRLNKDHCTTTATIDSEGTLHAETNLRFEGYRNIYKRNDLDSDGAEKLVKDILSKRYDNAEVDSFEIQTADRPDLPLKIRVKYTVAEFAQVNGDMMYLTSPALNIRDSNPFTSKSRHFPVEFQISGANTDIVDIEIPEGMKIAELPKTFNNQQPGIRFSSKWSQTDNKIKISREYVRQQSTFPRSKYKQLRQFFDTVVRADQGQIVLGPQSSE